ncbi:type II secretion system minor pseudopilin GspJ [Thalassotalea mangrovi]|uniref:Type II secretion system protein J n=1 Tax=Thalassotalea mangrovi TaxID=2572245 RepID=A0A4U1B9D7_9GAMM|nr:type II secretion system minor pseudopilin GspJ [Thalassotalea mangrovi]TKB46681.1 type II secretion system protein GspJ [Thalassotalea mangrovi]
MRNRGFTFLEVILAMAIFALVGLTSATMLSNVLKSSDIAEAKNARLVELQRAFLVMERDFLQMTKRSVRIEGEAPLQGFLHSNESTYSSNTHGIAFVRQGWSNPALLLPRSDLQAVAYQLEEDTLNRLHRIFVDTVVGEEPKVRALIQGVEKVDFEFFYSNKWIGDLQTGEELPKAIAVEIELQDLGLIRREFLVAGTGNDS